MRLDSDQSRTLQHTDGFALSVRHRVSAHTHAFHLSISGPDLDQNLFLPLFLSGHSMPSPYRKSFMTPRRR